MNARELVDHIRSGPVELVLDEPLRFRRRTRSNPCDFNEFLQALRSSETIRIMECGSQLELGIVEDEWVLLVKTIGSIRDIQHFEFRCTHGSCDFHPFQAVAEAVNTSHSLRNLLIGLDGATVPRDPSGLTALASALRNHTGLQSFSLINERPLLEAAAHSTAFDPVLKALLACPHIRDILIMTKSASADAIRSLLQLPADTALNLTLTPDQWLSVVDEIRRGHCLIKNLSLWMVRSSSFEATEAVKAVASAIREDHHLEHLTLKMENGFTDEGGVTLAEALTVNKTLRVFRMEDNMFDNDLVHTNTKASLGAQAYEAFATMLRNNTSIKLDLPTFDADVADESDIEHFRQMLIELQMNEVGRGRLLASSQTPREEWVNALQELNALNYDDLSFEVSCLYSLLQLHPDVCMLELHHTAIPCPV
jgi:hypothetical protein